VVGNLVLVAVLENLVVVETGERPALSQSQPQVLRTPGAQGQVRLCLQIPVVLLAILLVESLQIHLAPQRLLQALIVR
jgi:hypothetical protein